MDVDFMSLRVVGPSGYGACRFDYFLSLAGSLILPSKSVTCPYLADLLDEGLPGCWRVVGDDSPCIVNCLFATNVSTHIPSCLCTLTKWFKNFSLGWCPSNKSFITCTSLLIISLNRAQGSGGNRSSRKLNWLSQTIARFWRCLCCPLKFGKMPSRTPFLKPWRRDACQS